MSHLPLLLASTESRPHFLFREPFSFTFPESRFVSGWVIAITITRAQLQAQQQRLLQRVVHFHQPVVVQLPYVRPYQVPLMVSSYFFASQVLFYKARPFAKLIHLNLDADPIAGGLSFHTLSEYLYIAFAGVAIIVAVLLILRHAMHPSRPREQIR